MCLSLSQRWWWGERWGSVINHLQTETRKKQLNGELQWQKPFKSTTHVCVPSKQLFKDKGLVPLSLQLLNLALFLTCHRGSSVNDQCVNE